MENNNKNFERFKAQYYGQKVGATRYAGALNITNSSFKNIEWLELTPLSDITDEDAIDAYKKLYPKSLEEIYEYIIGIKEFIENETGVHNMNDIINCTDYLRSKGYALPYMDLSVDDLINYGWIKLKDNGK